MTDLVSAPAIPEERSVAWRLAYDARVRYVVLVATLAGAYYGAAQIGYTLKFTGAVAAIVWLPVGVGIAFLYLGGLNLWPGVVVGDLLANQYNALPGRVRRSGRRSATRSRSSWPRHSCAASCGTGARSKACPACAG